MAKKVEIEVDIKGNVVESSKNLKALKQELKDLPAGTAQWNKIKNDIRDVEDALQAAGQSSEDFKGMLENAPGPLGMLGGAIKKVELATKSFGGALKATGIGIIVGLIGGLVAAFSQTEGSMKKLEPLLIAMEQIFGGILEALQPIIDGFIELAIQVMPYVTKAFKVVYSAVTAVFQSLGKVGSAIVKLFKGDFAGAWEDAKSSVTGFSDNYDDAVDRFEKGAKKVTKTQKKNAEDAKAIADKALADKLKHMEAEDKIDEAKLEKMKVEAMILATTEQQKLDVEAAFAKKSYDLKKKDLEDKQKLYKKDSDEYKGYTAELIKLDTEYTTSKNATAEKQKEINEKERKALEDFNNEIADIKVNAVKDETKKLLAAEDTRFQKQRSKLVADMLALGKTTEEMNQALELIEQTHENNKTTIRTNAALKRDAIEKGDRDARYARIVAGAANDLALQRTMLEAKKKADDEYYAKQLAAENLTTEQIRELNEKKLADQILYTQKSNQIERDRISVKQKALDDIISIAGAETAVGRAALIAKQLLLAKELIMEVTRTITFSTQAAARSVVAVAEGTAQTAKIGFPQNIPMLIGYAAQAVAIIAAITSAVKGAKSAGTASTAGTAASSGSGIESRPGYAEGGMIEGPLHAGGGVMINAEGGEAVMTRGAVSMFGPLLSQLNQMGGGTSFSKGVSGQASYDNPITTSSEPTIIKTYVVAQDLTSTQHKQARLKDLSTL
jgi:hypothetical protein